MGSTIGVESTTFSRFTSRKGAYQQKQGKEVSSDDFMNHLLELEENAQTIADEIEKRTGDHYPPSEVKA